MEIYLTILDKTIDLQIIEIHFEDDPFHFRIPIDMCFNLSLLKISHELTLDIISFLFQLLFFLIYYFIFIFVSIYSDHNNTLLFYQTS